MTEHNRPNLEELKRRAPSELAHCEGYVWHLKSRIGKGSFGEVYLGWNTSGTRQVAVKVVKKEFFKQDPKVRENLEREIRIMKLLRGCDYVVHLYHVQELKATIVMVMELCEYDLDHLVKVQPFTEEYTTLLLFELAQGMKALREQNIVHRDLKPGNILIRKHPHTGKMMIKLADFGFARHFKDEGMKPIDMTSLAGTPVFMAPEALRCVFHPGEHYDDKVDIWSIGALLYKVIVGSCGFYAQLQDIPRILKHKGDAIAFERVPHSRKITYINELPASVNDRLSEPYREKMNRLLCAMLKIDPSERMNFTDFFEFVDDIITSKVEVINLLHGTTLKVILDPKMTSEQLMSAIEIEFQVSTKAQVIFSNSSPLFLSPDRALSHQHFTEMLSDAGGSRGHAILYLLPINHVVSDQVVADQRCLTLLKYRIEDEKCVELVLDHKFSDEIVHAIGQLQAQQRRQLTGLEEFCKFAMGEWTKFSSQSFQQMQEQGHKALAKVEVVLQWLQQDISTLGSSNQLPALLQAVEGQRKDIEACVRELQSFNGLLQLVVASDLTEDSIKATATLQDEAKRLSKMRRDHIQASCRGILDDCLKVTQEATVKILAELHRLHSNLAQVWSLGQKSVVLSDRCYTLDQLLNHISQERMLAMKSLSVTGVAAVQDRGAQNALNTPPVLVTPVGGAPPSPSWNAPQSNSFYPGTPPAVVGWGGQQQQQPPLSAETLKKENAGLQSQLETKNQECATLHLKVQQLSERKRSGDSTGYDEELGTIRPGDLRVPSPVDVESTMKPAAGHSGSGGEVHLTADDTRLFEALETQLRQFCLTAEKLKPGISSSPPEHRDKAQAAAMLYPSLLEDYSVISMPGEKKAAAPPLPTDVQALIPQASKLSRLLQSNVTTLESIAKSSALTPFSGHIKIAKPSQYEEGDVVIFHATKLQRTKSTAPILLHLDRPKPYVMMDASSYNNFNIRPGRMPDMIVARLMEKPKSFKFEENKDMAGELGESAGEFFKVRAEPTELRFATTRPSSRAPVRPPNRPPPPTTPTDKSPTTHKALFGGHRKGKEYV